MLGRKFLGTALAVLPLASAITPEELLAAPRRSEVLPNPSGEIGVFSATTYSWDLHKTHTVWNTLNLTSGEISLLYNGSEISEIVWVGPNDTSILYINGTNEEDNGGISIYGADITAIDQAYLIASLPTPYSGLKAVVTPSGDVNFLLNSLAWPNGTAYNEALSEQPLSTARLYDSIYVRHWDTWLSERKYAVFSGTLTGGKQYSFSGNLTNLVSGISNVTRAESPVGPFGDLSDYDISPDGATVAFLTKNVDLPLANYTSSQIYLVPHNGSSKAVPINAFSGASTPPNARGASYQPHFSPDGSKIAYVQMDGISYESDKYKIYVADVNPDNPNITVLAEDWDSTPDYLQWSVNGTSLFVRAPDVGNERIFEVPLSAKSDFKPTNITNAGDVSAFSVLLNGNLLVSDTKLYSSRDYYIISPNGDLVTDLFHANKVDSELAGLGPEDVSEFYTQGSLAPVQSFLVFPEGFNKSKKYPLAFIVHGGPQGGQYNAWSTRWNLKTWADQGYVVVAPNPTGSTGWGMAYQNAIQNQWGGYPYEDLVAVWENVNKNFSYIDTDRGIEAGASYGGYMTNWIQGHDLGRKFKALVTHDGPANLLGMYNTEELWFSQHEFNGTLWDNRDNYDRWNPINHARNFSTPHFVIHSSLDYRLPVSEGIMLFNILQERGVPSKFLNFPDENHWVQNRENSLVWHREIFNWINHYSGISK
ncbi:Dipeptidyl-peptidase 5 [Exophiala dermatitidis]|uniref:Dipeptidyl-peptidase V n=2 Tax=Exophiala dermatitidis TaxID=5970 RepID=H6C7A9_EXODN|nr:dipeptidyl aminopeptidase [Exophiala dermatitidis NIH/UT8656]KAJ4522633.1 Dipeptidyl-peptidase 5 [Exophiala dermatitidis]EHY59605.1 dipeptidyl aminopeptidase [Exophiala dermatitidis NIH/UT8656]KAJ4525934.1 Dipeptidyl-peptidase 5 [Exophiala dermatitidis]KAJ4527119.1 Dipeptidyl-peptidase 5 [Exophiala dermatitidis]KAJ4532837.1 Dipeptidyl-peptidase 5 [Exophiala dermatitidis]